MKKKKERRGSHRENLPTPEVGIIYSEELDGDGESALDGGGTDTFIINVLNRSEGGLLVESSTEFKIGYPVNVQIQIPDKKSWQAFQGKIRWKDTNQSEQINFLHGIKFEPTQMPVEVKIHKPKVRKKRMYPSDLEFIMQTELFDAISQEAKCPFLNCMISKKIRAGERIISQGEEGDSFFIIQEGSCLVNVEKDGTSHPVARLGAGDVVGEMAILTGEHRFANVDAETDMDIWCITRTHFDSLCEKYPDLRSFLTKVITRRFSTEGPIAERTIGKYLINEYIGKGGWSIVYRGVHKSLNMPVAIKMLRHDMAMNPTFLEKFRDEAKTIARFNHENIVQVYDIEELYRTTFIIMEYLEGAPLDHILDKIQRLPLSGVLDILFQTCTGLAYAHSQGIVHQDIKPDNIFIQPDNRVKIVDFGLACKPGTSHSSMTGTFFYMSPEQIEGDPIDERTDIYSLGITAYEMITGQRPFPEHSIAEALILRLREEIPDPRELVPDLPDELATCILRATRIEPDERYGNISQILHDLEPLAQQMGLMGQAKIREQRKMMSLFLFYQDEHQLMLNQLVEDFSNALKKMGAILRVADFKDI